MAVHSQRSRVFASVFAIPSKIHTTPTPLATPDTAFTAPGQPFGGPVASIETGSLDPAAREVKRGLAWSTATRYLSLHKHASQPTQEVLDAFSFLIGDDDVLKSGRNENSLVWYTLERRFFPFAFLFMATVLITEALDRVVCY